MTRDRDYRARDVYPLWRRRIRTAQASVRLYSPFLDRLAVDLLAQAPAGVAEKTLITDLSPASSAVTYRAQLLAIRRLLAAGVEVRTQPRLHAKVLLIDHTLVTLGSQNFTSYARKSKEATAAPATGLTQTAFTATLADWHDTAEPVTAEFVDRLLKQLAAAIRRVDNAAADLVAAYEQLEQEHQEQRRQERRRSGRTPIPKQMAAAAHATPYRPHSGPAWAKLRYLPRYDYTTLAAHYTNDLTYWPHEDRRRKPIRLTHPTFYPILIAPGRMAFARVAQTRITYLWSGFRRSTAVPIGGWWLSCLVEFVQDSSLDEANILLSTKKYAHAANGVTVRLRFDGVDLAVAGYDSYGTDLDVQLRDLLANAFGDPGQRKPLVDAVLKSFQPDRLGIQDHNAPDYFEPDTTYVINAITYESHPVLLASTYSEWRAHADASTTA